MTQQALNLDDSNVEASILRLAELDIKLTKANKALAKVKAEIEIAKASVPYYNGGYLLNCAECTSHFSLRDSVYLVEHQHYISYTNYDINNWREVAWGYQCPKCEAKLFWVDPSDELKSGSFRNSFKYTDTVK